VVTLVLGGRKGERKIRPDSWEEKKRGSQKEDYKRQGGVEYKGGAGIQLLE